MTVRDLGSLLVDEGVLPAAELQHIENARAGEGLPLWAAVLAAQRSSEDELFFVLARHGVATIADEQALAIIPPFGTDEEPLRQALTAREAREAGVLPLELAADGTATLVMVDPTDTVSLRNALERLGARRGRPLLARRTAVLTAIERAYDESARVQTAAQVPLEARRRRDVTGTVKVDPALAVELEALQQAPRPAPGDVTRPTTLPADAPAPAAHHDEGALPRVLLQVIEILAVELEQRLPPQGDADGSAATARDAGRLARRLARRCGLARRQIEEIGVAAQLAVLDRLLRADSPDGKEPFAALGWGALGEGGLLTLVRTVLREPSSPSPSPSPVGDRADTEPPLAADIVGVVYDFVALEAPRAGGADLEALSQLLRAAAGRQRGKVVDLLVALFADEPRPEPSPDHTPTTPSESPPPRARGRRA